MMLTNTVNRSDGTSLGSGHNLVLLKHRAHRLHLTIGENQTNVERDGISKLVQPEINQEESEMYSNHN